MTDFNLEWLEENFSNRHVIIYNIGCADLTDDSLRFKTTLPNSTVYSFECAECWKIQNYGKSKNYNLPYFHKAVSYFDGKIKFAEIESKHPNYSGTATKHRGLEKMSVVVNKTTEVDAISLNEICKSIPPPDILHIDAEREEYNILRNVSSKYMPDVIWLENNKYYNNENFEPCVSYSTLKDLLVKKGYIAKPFKLDSLFIKKNSCYSEYLHRTHNIEQWTEHERKIQEKIWLLRYDLCKDYDWPILLTVEDFFSLPLNIQRELKVQFDLEPDRRFFLKTR